MQPDGTPRGIVRQVGAAGHVLCTVLLLCWLALLNAVVATLACPGVMQACPAANSFAQPVDHGGRNGVWVGWPAGGWVGVIGWGGFVG